jgi:hypothetical protein
MLSALECGMSGSTSCGFLSRRRYAPELLDAETYGDVLI